MEQRTAAHVSAWLRRGVWAFLLFLLLLGALGCSAAFPLARAGALAEPPRGQRTRFAVLWVLPPAFGSPQPACGGDAGVHIVPPLPAHISEHPGRVLGG